MTVKGDLGLVLDQQQSRRQTRVKLLTLPFSIHYLLLSVTVKGDKVSCSINNKVVGTYDRSALVTTGKLKSTDGTYGIRFAHNTDATVTDLKKTKAQ